MIAPIIVLQHATRDRIVVHIPTAIGVLSVSFAMFTSTELSVVSFSIQERGHLLNGSHTPIENSYQSYVTSSPAYLRRW